MSMTKIEIKDYVDMDSLPVEFRKGIRGLHRDWKLKYEQSLINENM